MFGARQTAFFASFSDFWPDATKPALSEWCRLADVKGWEAESALYRSFFRACFNSEAPSSSINSNLESEESSAPVKADPKIEAPSADNGLSLLESRLKQLNIDNASTTNASSSVIIATPTRSIDDDGVIVRYFDTFPSFEPDNSAPLRVEFDRLATQEGWAKNSSVYRDQYIRCCTDEFKYFCGDNHSRLEAWQDLAIDITGLVPAPSSKNQCRKLLELHKVNIFDYIDCKRQRKPIEPIFTTKSSFRKYTLKKANIFPKSAAKSNPLLSIMLEKLFGHR